MILVICPLVETCVFLAERAEQRVVKVDLRFVYLDLQVAGLLSPVVTVGQQLLQPFELSSGFLALCVGLSLAKPYRLPVWCSQNAEHSE